MESTTNAVHELPPADDGGIGLLDILKVVGDEKWLIASMAAIGAVVGVVVALQITPTFTARTTLLPPQGAGGSAAAASLGAVAAALGAGGVVKTPEELYLGLLRSETIADGMVERFNLRERFKATLAQDARGGLSANSRFAVDRKSSLITVEVDDKDPARRSWRTAMSTSCAS
jgi:tyrosine-protein kinase Etk/Wzc